MLQLPSSLGRVVAASAIVASFALATSCATSDNNDSGPLALPTLVFEGSRVREYHTLGDLEREATIVAVVEPSGKPSLEPMAQGASGPEPQIQVIPMKLVEVLAGDAKAGDLVNVRGNLITTTETGNDVLTMDTQFLVYLMPFEFEPGKPTGQLIAVGGPAGVFVDLRADNTQSFSRLDPLSMDLPSTVSAAEARLAHETTVQPTASASPSNTNRAEVVATLSELCARSAGESAEIEGALTKAYTEGSVDQATIDRAIEAAAAFNADLDEALADASAQYESVKLSSQRLVEILGQLDPKMSLEALRTTLELAAVAKQSLVSNLDAAGAKGC